MPDYRLLYFGEFGSIVSFKVLSCADDATAVEEAEKDPDPRAKELWEGRRLVKAISAKRPPPTDK